MFVLYQQANKLYRQKIKLRGTLKGNQDLVMSRLDNANLEPQDVNVYSEEGVNQYLVVARVGLDKKELRYSIEHDNKWQRPTKRFYKSSNKVAVPEIRPFDDDKIVLMWESAGNNPIVYMKKYTGKNKKWKSSQELTQDYEADSIKLVSPLALEAIDSFWSDHYIEVFHNNKTDEDKQYSLRKIKYGSKPESEIVLFTKEYELIIKNQSSRYLYIILRDGSKLESVIKKEKDLFSS